MEPEPQKDVRPPVLIDGIVRLLVPPASREAVIGDLWERYRSPGQYLLEAFSILPSVIASRVRRATNPALLAVTGIILFGCFGGFVADTGANDVPRWARAALPTGFASFGLILRDAYKTSAKRSGRGALADVAMVAVFVLAVESALALLASVSALSPDWILSPQRFSMGGAGLFALFLIRFGLGDESELPRPRAGAKLLAPDLAYSYRRFRERVGRRNVGEISAGLVLVAISVNVLLSSEDTALLAVGWMWNIGHLLFLAFLALAGRAAGIREGVGVSQLCEHYRAELERQRRLRRLVWWWYLTPLFLGIALHTIAPGIVSGAGRIAFGLAAIIVLALVAERLTRARDAAFQKSRAQLRAMRDAVYGDHDGPPPRGRAVGLASVRPAIGLYRSAIAFRTTWSARLVAMGLVGACMGGFYTMFPFYRLESPPGERIIYLPMNMEYVRGLSRIELAQHALAVRAEKLSAERVTGAGPLPER